MSDVGMIFPKPPLTTSPKPPAKCTHTCVHKILNYSSTGLKSLPRPLPVHTPRSNTLAKDMLTHDHRQVVQQPHALGPPKANLGVKFPTEHTSHLYTIRKCNDEFYM